MNVSGRQTVKAILLKKPDTFGLDFTQPTLPYCEGKKADFGVILCISQAKPTPLMSLLYNTIVLYDRGISVTKVEEGFFRGGLAPKD